MRQKYWSAIFSFVLLTAKLDVQFGIFSPWPQNTYAFVAGILKKAESATIKAFFVADSASNMLILNVFCIFAVREGFLQRGYTARFL